MSWNFYWLSRRHLDQRERGDLLSPPTTNVLVALLRVHRRDGHVDVSTVAIEAGLCKSTTHGHLCTLRDAGLIAWEPLHVGTLHPLVAPVPFGGQP